MQQTFVFFSEDEDFLSPFAAVSYFFTFIIAIKPQTAITIFFGL